jgi:tetratricopeptide (TPR) repeat protein
MNLKASPAAEVARLEEQALSALQQGRERESIAVWKRLLALDPAHVRALTMVGQYAFRQSDFAAARQAFEQAARADGRDPRQWTNLAFVCERLGDEAAESDALFRAASADPSDLLTLILRGQLYERQGRARAANQVYGAATLVAPPLERLSPELRPALQHAMEFRHQHVQDFGAHIDRALAPLYADCQGEDLERFRLAVDIMLERRRRYISQPMQFFYPGLEPVEFFDRGDFPWLPALEARTDAIRDEFLHLLDAEEGFTPYITYAADQPLNQWAELNNSPKWSAYHLVKDGSIVADQAARCPQTMDAWSRLPAPEQALRTPNAMFSLLRPHTRIPAHVGSSNVRLVLHLPLIIPAGCRYRVGNTVREWVPGTAWVFDDTIEHEAWNDSDKLRVIFMCDLWHPALSAAERRMITALSAGLNDFAGAADAGYAN